MFFLLNLLIVCSFSTQHIFSAAAHEETSSKKISDEKAPVIACLEELFIQAHDDISEPSRKEFLSLQKMLVSSQRQQMSAENKGFFIKKEVSTFFQTYGAFPLLTLGAMGNKAFFQTDIISLKSILYILTDRFWANKEEDAQDFNKIKTTFPLFSDILITHILKQSHAFDSIAHLESFNEPISSNLSFKDIHSLLKLSKGIAAGEKIDRNYETFFTEEALPFIKRVVMSHNAELLKIASNEAKVLIPSLWCVIL